MITCKTESHADDLKDALRDGLDRALDAVGAKAAGYAFLLSPVDTGRLHNSITWAIKGTDGRTHDYKDDSGKPYSQEIGTGIPEGMVVVGTNVEYSAYQEFGTSKTRAQPYLRPAVERHLDEYKEMFRRFLSE